MLTARPSFSAFRPPSILVIATWICAFTVALVAQATVVEPLDVRALASESNRVVRAHVLHQSVVPERGPQGQIYTRTSLRIVEDILGSGPRDIIVQQLGGQLGDLRMTVSGNAHLKVGTEVILFLDRDPATELHYVVGLAQGHYEIDRSTVPVVVRRDLEGLTFYRVGPQPVPEILMSETLQSLMEQIRPTLNVIDISAPGGLR